MSDLDRDPTLISGDGHTEPVSSYTGAAPLAAGLRITVGTAGSPEQEWHVIRIDPPSSDDTEGVFHIKLP